MKKLISFRKTILIVGGILTLALATVQLIFGQGDSYISNAVMMIVFPLFVFAFFRFTFYMWSKKKMFGVIKFFSWFLFLGGVFFTLGGIPMIFVNFPNVAAPPFSIGLSMLVCVLYSNAKINKDNNT